MKRALLSIAFLGLLAPAHALYMGDVSGGQGSASSGSSGGGSGLTSVAPSNLTGTPPTAGQVPVAQAGDTWAGGDLITEYTEPIMIYPEYSMSTSNGFDTTASTNPFYGKMRFDPTLSSATNCGRSYVLNFRNYLSTAAVVAAVRLDQFFVLSGTTTDTNQQSYVVRIASLTDNQAIPTTFSFPHTITVNAGTGTLKPRWQATVTSFTDWAAVVDVGAPVGIEICRDGADTSTAESWGGIMELRLATNSP